jgi:mono/diheme cytochrome c family protein
MRWLAFVSGLGTVVLGTVGWVVAEARSELTGHWDVHRVDFPIVSTPEAVERGRHLIEARYGCGSCHGEDFGGGKMVDEPLIGRWLAPNLTTGEGSRTLDYTAADWDRIVRHGVKPDGTAAVMPAEDFFGMSDQELADIVAYVRSLPPVDRTVPTPTFGPLGTALLASGKLELAATIHPTGHAIDHPAEPPPSRADATFGRHLAGVCSGCHGTDLTGGPIVGGPPDWPPAANLTELDGWTHEGFVTAMRTGIRPDGSALRPPMSSVVAHTAKMTHVEVEALWTFLETLQE